MERIANRYFQKTFTATHLFLLTLIAVIGLFWLNVAVFLDDVFIYLRVAQNIANGTGPVLNPGDTHFPVTSPLWVFLLALLHKIFGFIDLVQLAKILYVLFLSVASWLAFLIFREKIGRWAVLCTFPIFFNFITVSCAGGEIALTYAALTATLWAYYKKKNSFLTGLFLAVGYLARGELILLSIPVGLHFLFWAVKEKKKLKEITAEIGRMALGFLAIALLWHIYYAVNFHTLFPNTLNAKSIQGKSGRWELYYRFGRIHTLSILDGHYYLLFFLGFGLYYFRFLSFALLSYTVLHYYVYRFLIIPYYHWYFYDFYLLIPLLILLGIAGFLRFAGNRFLSMPPGAAKTGRYSRPVQAAAITAALSLCLVSILITTRGGQLGKYGGDSRLVRYKSIADKMKPLVKKNDVVLAHEIGIIGYYLAECIIRDLNGIASPDVTTDNICDLDYFVGAYSPRFILFPAWIPQKNPIKYVATNHRLAVYEKCFDETCEGVALDSVFMFKDNRRLHYYIRTLDTLRKNAECCPGRKCDFVRLRRRFVLSVPAPFRSRLTLPANVNKLKICFGFRPGMCRPNTGTNSGEQGVHFVVYGIDGKKKEQVYRQFASPPINGINDRVALEKSAAISLAGRGFDSLEFAIEPVKPVNHSNAVNTVKGTYWGPIRFTLRDL